MGCTRSKVDKENIIVPELRRQQDQKQNNSIIQGQQQQQNNLENFQLQSNKKEQDEEEEELVPQNHTQKVFIEAIYNLKETEFQKYLLLQHSYGNNDKLLKNVTKQMVLKRGLYYNKKNLFIRELELEDFQFLAEAFESFGNLTDFALNIKKKNLGEDDMFMTYLGICLQNQHQLAHIFLNLSENKLGINKDNFSYLKLGFYSVQDNLKTLNLDLSRNDIDGHVEVILEITNGIGFLNCLESLQLNLANNKLGLNSDNFKILVQGFCTKKSLKRVELDLEDNQIGENLENMQFLMKGFKKLTQLSTLKLNLAKNNLGQNMENLQSIADYLQLQENLRNIELNFYENGLGKEVENFQIIEYGLKGMKGLEKLILNFGFNNMDKNIQNMTFLVFGLNSISSLRYLDLLLKNNNLYKNRDENSQILNDGLQKFKQMENFKFKFNSQDIQIDLQIIQEQM